MGLSKCPHDHLHIFPLHIMFPLGYDSFILPPHLHKMWERENIWLDCDKHISKVLYSVVLKNENTEALTKENQKSGKITPKLCFEYCSTHELILNVLYENTEVLILLRVKTLFKGGKEVSFLSTYVTDDWVMYYW